MSPFDIVPIAVAQEPASSRATPLMCDTVTLYNALGETDRRATYGRTVLERVRVQESSGAVAALAGSVSTDGLTVFIPGGTSGYVAPEVYVGTGWTLREDDLLVVGECTSDIPPVTVQQLEASREVYRITGIETLSVWARGVHHWEVAAE